LNKIINPPFSLIADIDYV